MIIRAMEADDLGAVCGIGQQSLQTPWTREQMAAELNIPNGLQLVAELPALCAYSIFRRAGAEAELLQIAVSTSLRRKGVASALLQYGVVRLLALDVEDCFLEVRSRNKSGRFFYKQAGFHRVGLRRKYYSQPVDDAVIMKKRLKQG